MTLLVGILCKDGVVMGSDSAATFGSMGRHTIGQQEVQKVQCLTDRILFSATGSIGMGQLIANLLQSNYDTNKLQNFKSAEQAMGDIGTKIGALVKPFLESGQLLRSLIGDASGSLCKCLVALPIKDKPELFEFDFNGAPERKTMHIPFVALGTGQPIADPFLAFLRRVLWNDREPTLAEGRLVAAWTIQHVIGTNPGGVAGHVQLATLASGTKGYSCSLLEEDNILEHAGQAEAAERAMVMRLRNEDTAASPPPSPTPEPGSPSKAA